MIELFSCSEPGGHRGNEDAFAVRPHPADPDCFLCVVADGQGGRAGGASAAQRACQACVDLTLAHAPAQLLLPATWMSLLRAVDQAVADHAGAGFTTLVAFCLTPLALCGASSGDSAALAASAGQPAVILTGRQIKNPPVGSGAALFVPFTARLLSPWTVLALSDGVWKYAGWDHVFQAAEKRGAEVAKTLRQRAQLRNGELQDDFTLVVLQDGPVVSP